MRLAEASARKETRRRSRRTPLHLRGRVLLSDGGEHACETIDVSVTGLAIKAHVLADLGERVVIYLDELGRFEGLVVRREADWFAIEAKIPRSRLDRLAEKIAALSGESDVGGAPPSASQARPAELRTGFGQCFAVQLCDESRFDARIVADFRLLPGVRVEVDGKPAVVVHESKDGFVVAFQER